MLKIKFHHKLNEKKIKIPENVECHKRWKQFLKFNKLIDVGHRN
jgi:hypothetical protein